MRPEPLAILPFRNPTSASRSNIVASERIVTIAVDGEASLTSHAPVRPDHRARRSARPHPTVPVNAESGPGRPDRLEPAKDSGGYEHFGNDGGGRRRSAPVSRISDVATRDCACHSCWPSQPWLRQVVHDFVELLLRRAHLGGNPGCLERIPLLPRRPDVGDAEPPGTVVAHWNRHSGSGWDPPGVMPASLRTLL